MWRRRDRAQATAAPFLNQQQAMLAVKSDDRLQFPRRQTIKRLIVERFREAGKFALPVRTTRSERNVMGSLLMYVIGYKGREPSFISRLLEHHSTEYASFDHRHYCAPAYPWRTQWAGVHIEAEHIARRYKTTYLQMSLLIDKIGHAYGLNCEPARAYNRLGIVGGDSCVDVEFDFPAVRRVNAELLDWIYKYVGTGTEIPLRSILDQQVTSLIQLYYTLEVVQCGRRAPYRS